MTYELWQFDKAGEYVGSFSETFYSYREAQAARKAIAGPPALRARWHIVRFDPATGLYLDLKTNEITNLDLGD